MYVNCIVKCKNKIVRQSFVYNLKNKGASKELRNDNDDRSIR